METLLGRRYLKEIRPNAGLLAALAYILTFWTGVLWLIQALYSLAAVGFFT
jgi:hypothetical protein